MNQLYLKKNIISFEIEATTYCNAFCGDCDRNINGGERAPIFDLNHMSDTVVDNLFTQENLKYIRRLHFDGNLGDASMHPFLLQMLEKINNNKSDLIVTMSTNGGARSTEFWKNLAITLKKFKYHRVAFAIDGLEDTNHIYRRGVIWSRLIENLQEFNTAGGHSQWKSIIFDYNKDQILSMIKIAHEIGCGGFVTNRNRRTGKIISCQSYKKFPKAKITSPSFEEFKEKYNIKLKFRKHIYTPISELSFDGDYPCPFGQEGKVSIDIFGNIWPCCFFYSNSFKTWNKTILNKFYTDNINIVKNNYTDILDFIRTDLYSAWKQETYSLCNNCLHKKIPPLT